MTRSKALAAIKKELGDDCMRCGLCEGRKTVVFGSGSADTPLMFIGEGPGADEDVQGLPFVGRAGQLLTKMIEAMGWTRDTVYIANIVKCRPPENREPSEAEIAACLPFLMKQILAVQPEVIVTLGRVATRVLTCVDDSMSRMHGRVYEMPRLTVPIVPTFHPAFLLRTPSGKPYAWRDLKNVNRLLKKLGFQPPNPPKGSPS